MTQSPTLSLGATQPGVILGTAAYMSPEQAKGTPADKRSDIWAFGCVLFEMLTGRRAFDAPDVTETLALIVLREPDWSLLPAGVPPAIRTLLRRCLDKDRRTRIAHISAALVLIDEAPNLVGPAQAEPSRRPRSRIVAACIGLAAASLAGTAVWWTMRTAPPRVVRTELTTAGPAALRIQGNVHDIAITPDGAHLIYHGGSQLFVRAFDQLEPQVLAASSGAPLGPFVSPDGQWVGFFDTAGVLKRVSIAGGPAVAIAKLAGSPRGATWGADGTIVYATNAGTTGLQRVSAAGREPVVLTRPNRERGEGGHIWPEFLPGRDAVLFTIAGSGAAGNVTNNAPNAQIAVLDLRTGMYKVVVRDGHHARYVPTGHLVYGAGGPLRAVAFDIDKLEAVGAPVPVLEGVATTGQGAVNVAVANNCTMVYVPGSAAGPVRSLAWVDRSGREESIGAPPHVYIYPRLSPDGTRVALYAIDQEQDVWVWHFNRRTLTRVTVDPVTNYYPVWSPDANRIFYASALGGTSGSSIYAQSADGTGTPVRLLPDAPQPQPTDITTDGRWLIFHQLRSMRRDLMLLPLDDATGARPLLQTPFEERNGVVSPNGRWLAYESDTSGSFEIYIRPFPNVDQGQWQVSNAGGTRPLWSRDGKELFYLAEDGAVMALGVATPGTAFNASPPIKLFEGAYYTGLGTANIGRTYDVSPDGRRFLMIKLGGINDDLPQNLVVVQNWDQELKRLLPTRQ